MEMASKAGELNAMPLLGYVDEISRARVSGWVADTQNPRTPVTLNIVVNGRSYGSCKAERSNPDLIRWVGPSSTGHHGFLYEFDPPLSVFRFHEITLEIAADKSFRLENGSRKLPIPAVPPGAFTPLIVTSTGRSGATRLMREFKEHPRIVLADRHPYEIKLVAYYASAYRALVSNEDRTRSTDPNSMFVDENRFRIGHNPYNTPALYSLIQDTGRMAQLFEISIPQGLAHLFRGSIEEFYGLIKASDDKHAANVFAEKGDLDEAAREGARLLFGGVKEVVLVRDARDMLCAAKAFWSLSFERALSILQADLPRLTQIKQGAGADVFFLRYEDLIDRPGDTRKRLFEFLGLEYTPGIERDASAAQGPPAEAEWPVGGWRTSLTEGEIAQCRARFETYQEMFGYATEVGGASALPAARFHRFADGKDLATILRLDGQEWLDNMAVYDCANFQEILVAGWSAIERDYVWSCKPEAALRLAIPAAEGSVYIRLIVDSFRLPDKLLSQRVSVSVDDAPPREVTVDALGVIDCRLPKCPRAREVFVRLRLPDARRPCDLKPNSSDDRLLGISLRRLVVSHTTAANDSATDAPQAVVVPTGGEPQLSEAAAAAMMSRFESLGENCEFGLVQRRCGAEPLGLLRFSSAPLAKLLAALNARFAGMGAPENVSIELSSNAREYMVQDRAFGFYYHAWVKAGDMAPEKIHAREVARVPFLVRKLIEDLTDGAKIFVFHAMQDMSLASARKLSEAIRSFGPGLLLWVRLADRKHPQGSMENLGGGLLAGYVDRFAPDANAHDLSLESWIDLCRNTVASVHGEDHIATLGGGNR